ncbi:MAG: SGNH/GDSL hydrolase family protein [Acidobacteria bacterium]|nr:SGNH/GDSL hydrolase family protein [Acidobacteriota bacterium]
MGEEVAAAGAAGTRGIHLIGDSWAAGLHADPANALGQVAARAIGWPITVDAVSGTGYLNDAGAMTYLQRAEGASGTERLVILQGGSNDDDEDLGVLAAAVTATITALQRRFPQARVLVLGPGPDPAPVTARQWAVDALIAEAAQDTGVAWVSMLHERWIPAEHLDAVIDPANHHPTISGQQYLGLRLAAAIRLTEPDLLAS